MNCQDATALVEKLADGEATVEEKARAEAHLETCESCRSHFAFLTSVAETRRSQALPEPPEAYWRSMTRNIQMRIAEEKIPGSRGHASSRAPALMSGIAMRLVGLAAGVVLAVAVVWNVVLLPRRDAPSSSAVSSPAVAEPSIAAPLPEDEEALREPAPPAFGSEPMRRADAETREPGVARVAPGVENGPEPQRAAKATEDARALEASPAEDFAPAEARDAPPFAAQAPSAVTTHVRAADEALSTLGAASNRSRSPAEAEPQPNCERFRETLQTIGEGEGAAELSFQLARCELARYEREPSEETRARAIADAEAFLMLESEGGGRAEEIRRALARLRR